MNAFFFVPGNFVREHFVSAISRENLFGTIYLSEAIHFQKFRSGIFVPAVFLLFSEIFGGLYETRIFDSSVFGA